jgi:hypothetical protein
MLQPLVDLMVPIPHHLNAGLTRLQLVYENVNNPSPVFVLGVPGDAASHQCCVIYAPGGIVHHSLPGHGDEIIGKPVEERLVFWEFLRSAEFGGVAHCSDENGAHNTQDSFQDVHQSWDYVARPWHAFVLSGYLDPILEVTKFDEWASDASATEADKRGVLKKRWEMDHLPLLLAVGQVLDYFSAIFVSEGQSPQLCNQNHGVASDVHFPSSEVSKHIIEVLAAQIGHDEANGVNMLRGPWHMLH